MTYDELKKSEQRLAERLLAEADRLDAEEDKALGDKRGDEFPTAKEALELVRRARKELEAEEAQKRTERVNVNVNVHVHVRKRQFYPLDSTKSLNFYPQKMQVGSLSTNAINSQIRVDSMGGSN